MHCPKCASAQNTVKDSRPEADRIRRRRLCIKCRHRWSTYEMAKKAPEIMDLAALRAQLASVMAIIDRLQPATAHAEAE